MMLPPEINAIRYYELEIKARGFDILQELEALTDRVSILKNEKTKVIKELQSLYTKVQEQEALKIKEVGSDVPGSPTTKKTEDKNRTIKTAHDISGTK